MTSKETDLTKEQAERITAEIRTALDEAARLRTLLKRLEYGVEEVS